MSACRYRCSRSQARLLPTRAGSLRSEITTLLGSPVHAMIVCILTKYSNAMIVALGLRLAIFRNHAIRLILVTVPFPDGPYSFETDAGRRYSPSKSLNTATPIRRPRWENSLARTLITRAAPPFARVLLTKIASHFSNFTVLPPYQYGSRHPYQGFDELNGTVHPRILQEHQGNA